jgi:hypothetical protein
MTRVAGAPRRVLATSPFKNPEVVPASTSEYSVGDRVTHDRRGMGRVVAVDEQFVTVDFGAGQLCRVPAGARGFSRL